MRIFKKSLLAVTTVALLSVGVQAEGDAAKGKKVYGKCKACHSFDAKARKMGPTFAGILGRKAGSVEGYRYSKAFQQTDFTWDEEKLADFMLAPKKMVKGNKMPFGGLRKPQDIENLIAFLKSKAE
ncbi:MAG: cytochrome c family protein [Kordiimonadaceae bacterium]|nr:cytochrome c family protein [Kordiimonadaceae bacterium]